MLAERTGGVSVAKRVVTMRSPSAKRSCMVSACSIILFLVMIISNRVDDVFVGGVICRAETSLPRSCWSSEVVCFVASLISSDNWTSRSCGIGNGNRIDLGWSGSHVVFVVECGCGCSRGMCMVAFTSLCSRNA